jgi:hypothetical protein
MARLDINVGANANDGTGDDLRTAMQKINTNFAELYGTTAEANDLVEDGTPQLGGNLDVQNYIITTSNPNGDITITPNGTGSVNLGAVTINGTRINDNDSSGITIDTNQLSVTGDVALTGSLKFGVSGNPINEFSTDVTLGGAGAGSDAVIPTQKAIKAYIEAESVSATSIIFVDDASNSATIQVGNTLAVEGAQNITTSISDDTLTITGPDLSSYATESYVDTAISSLSIGDLVIGADDSSQITIDLDATTLNVKGSVGISTSVTGDTLTITGPDLTNYVQSGDDISDLNNNAGYITASSSDALTNKTGNISQWTNDSGYITNITLNVSADDSNTITVSNNGGLVFSGGTGISTSTSSGGSVTISRDTITNLFNVGADDSTTQNIGEGDTLTIEGGAGLVTSLSGNTLTVSLQSIGGGGSLGYLEVIGQQIIGTQTNSDITITPEGVGQINLESDVIRVGNLDTDVTISSNGTGDLILKTDVDNPSVAGMGSITIGSGTDGILSIRSGDSGYIKVGNIDWSDINAGVAERFYNGFTSAHSFDYRQSRFDRKRIYANSTSAKVTVYEPDLDNGEVLGFRAHQSELYTDLRGQRITSEAMITFDSSSRNAGIPGSSGGQVRGYSNGPVVMGLQNQIRNNSNTSSGYISETASLGIYTTFGHSSTNGDITVDQLNGVATATNFAFQGGTTTVNNSVDFLAGGGYVTNGNVTVANSYAFYASGLSEATNRYGIYIEAEDWENYLGGLTIANSTISADRSNENLILQTAGTGKVVVNDTLSVNTVELNNISSADSSAVTINDNLDISGTLLVNNIGSADSSAVTINNNLDVSGTLLVNEISSADSSAIQIVDDLNISGVLTVSGDFVVSNFITNTISSDDSTSVTVNDDLTVTGTAYVNEIGSQDSSPIQINDSVKVVGASFTADAVYVNTIASHDSNTVQINDSMQVSDNLTVSNGVINLSTNSTTPNEFAALTPVIGSITYCTDELGSGAQPVYYDGTNWRRISDLGVMNSSTTAYFQSLTADDSGTLSASSHSSFYVEGGTGITTSISGSTLRIEAIGIPGGADTQVQFNDGGAFGGDAGFTYNKSTDTLTITNIETNSIQAPSSLVGTYTISSPTTITLDPTDEIINDAPMKLVSKTVTQLGSLVSSVGAMVFCTDETGGAIPAFYDGTNWRRVSDRAIVS